MTPAADFHGSGDLLALPGEQAANAFALASRSTSAYTFVVLILACPSHPRIVLISTPARSRCVAVECRLCCQRYSRHSAAMALLAADVDSSVIALWLGHESVNTTQTYLHAHLALKEAALAKTTPHRVKPGRFRPGDQLLQFL